MDQGLPDRTDGFPMRGISVTISRSQSLLIIAAVCLSAVVSCLYGTGHTKVLAVLAGIVAVAVLVWDLRIVVPILIFVLPYGPKFPMSFGNLYLATIIVILAIGAWILRNPFLSEPFTLPRNRITDAVAILLAVMCIASLQNLPFLLAHRASLLRFVQFLLYTSLFFLFLQMSFSHHQTRVLLVLVLLAGIGEGVLGVWQWLRYPGYYVAGTFDDTHSLYAGYIVFIIFLTLGVTLETRNRWALVGCIAALCVMLYGLVFSFGRGAYVAFLGSIPVLLAMPASGRRRVILAITVVAAGFAVLAVLPADVMQRGQSVIANLTGQDVGISFGERLKLWEDALVDFSRNPILGKGTWSYSLRDNFFMKILGEAGLLGLLAFIWLLWVLLVAEWRIIRARINDDLIRGIAIGLLPATVGCLIIADLAIDMFLHHRFMGTFWLVVALLVNYYRKSGRTRYVEA